MNFIKYAFYLNFVMLLYGAQYVYAAGIKISTEFPTKIQIALTNGTIRAFDITGISTDLLEMFTYDAFFRDGPTVGIISIKWQGTDKLWYERVINMRGSEGFRVFRITQDNVLVDLTQNYVLLR